MYSRWVGWCHPNIISERPELLLVESLGEDVGDHAISRTVGDHKLLSLHLLLDKVVADVDVLGATMELGIVRDFGTALIILTNCQRLSGGEAQLSEEEFKEDHLLHAVEKDHILRFSGGEHHRVVLPREPKDCTLSKGSDVAADGAARVLTVSIVRVGVCGQVIGKGFRGDSRCPTENDAVVDRAVDVSKATHNRMSVGLAKVCQKLTDLSHEEGEVRTCVDHQIHHAAHDRPVGERSYFMNVLLCLRLHVNREFDVPFTQCGSGVRDELTELLSTVCAYFR
jgi:hypothetical protein